MDRGEDIAAALPEPPPPSPARRAAAFEAALRRFDGGEAEAAAAARPPSRRPRLNRPLLGTAIAASLVLLIGLPTAWITLQPPAPSERSFPPSATPVEKAASRAARTPAPSQPEPASGDRPEAASVEAEAATPRADVDPATAQKSDAQEIIALGRAQGPSLPSPSPMPPPPPALAPQKPEAVAESRMRAMPDRKSADFAARSESSRADGLAQAPASAAQAREEGNDLVVTGMRTSRNLYASRRGDWNACTVNDPARSLERCRRQIAAAGKEGASLSEGLSRAWSGDSGGAIAAFDAAIAANPRSSYFYLNRGLVLGRDGETDRAIADLDKAVRYGSASARAYYNRSLLLRARGDTRRADRDQARAVDLDPDYAEIVP